MMINMVFITLKDGICQTVNLMDPMFNTKALHQTKAAGHVRRTWPGWAMNSSNSCLADDAMLMFASQGSLELEKTCKNSESGSGSESGHLWANPAGNRSYNSPDSILCVTENKSLRVDLDGGLDGSYSLIAARSTTWKIDKYNMDILYR